MKARKGFTLIEMLIVITIIVLLISLLAILIRGVISRARYARTKVFIETLDKACASYKLDYHTYPENNKGDSRCLHYYLGRPRTTDAFKVAQGTAPQVSRPAIMEFTPANLQLTGTGVPDPNQPAPLIDSWNNLIKYKGVKGGVKESVYNVNGVDIWSSGENGVDELKPDDPKFDDVTNWVRDF